MQLLGSLAPSALWPLPSVDQLMLGKWLLPQRMVRERVVGEVIKNVDFSGAARLFFAGMCFFNHVYGISCFTVL
jgi:hypothetical protein